MTLPKHRTAETDLLQAAWLKAHAEGEVRLSFDAAKTATSVRFKLYNAVKSAREGGRARQELKDAVHACELLQPENGKMIIIRLKSHNPLLAGLAAQLGVEVPRTVSREEPVEEPVQSLYGPRPVPVEDISPSLEFLQAVQERPKNPFFDREGE